MKQEHKKYILENINKKSIDTIARELNIKARKIKKFIKEEKKKQVKSAEDIRSSTKIDRRRVFISVILIVTLGFIVYSNSINGEFIWDDQYLIKDNVYIKNLSHLPKIFTENIKLSSGRKWEFYRPFQILTYMADYFLWKLNVIGYHLTNILLHILVAISIYYLITILYRDALLSLFTSLLFIVHPIHTEAVAYISGRADPLATTFMLLCFIFYIKYLHSESPKLYTLMILTYVLALLSRESSLSLPILLLLYHYAFKKKLKFKEFLSILGITFAYILMRFTVLRSLLIHLSSKTSLFQRIPGFFVAITNYIRLIFLPFELHMEYGNKLFHFSEPKAILGVTILFLSLIYAFSKRKSNGLIFLSISWFIISLLPQSNLYPINAYMAEHWLYLPSIGFFLIIASGFRSLYRTEKYQSAVIVLLIGLLAFYSTLTIKQNNYWKELIVFYERTLKYAPNSDRVLNNLGNVYKDIGKREETIALYKKALEINPNHAEAYNNLGLVYNNIGNKEGAIALYKKALEINPLSADVYNNLGLVYSNIGNKEEAIALYKKALEINPNHAEVYYNLGNAYKDIGKKEEAIALYKKAIEINPNFAEAYNHLGVVYTTIDKRKEAIALYKKAIEINPNYATAHNNLAAVYYYEKQYDLAIKHCDRAIELGVRIHPEFLKLLEPYRK